MPESGKLTLKAQLASEVAHIRRARPEIGIVAIADGAADNWTFLETLSPETEVIDFWHACEHLQTASDHAVAPGWFEKYREILRHDPRGVAKVIRALRHLRDAAAAPDRAETERELAFFRKHRHRMRYHALKEEGIAIGSGVVEAANKTLVTQRMKRSGMRWRIVGGQAVLTFRALIKSGRFERAWKALISATDTPAKRQHQSTCSSHGNRCLNSTNQAADITAMRDSHPISTASAHGGLPGAGTAAIDSTVPAQPIRSCPIRLRYAAERYYEASQKIGATVPFFGNLIRRQQMPPRNEIAAPAGVEHTTLYVAIEISRKSWVVGIKSPVNERIGLHTIEAANVDALRDLIERHRAKAEQVLDHEVRVLNC